MSYSNLIKSLESSMESLSKKSFFSIEDIKDEIIREWEQTFTGQSGNLISLLKESNLLFIGITADTVPDNKAFCLFRFLRLARKKTVYRFQYEKVKEPLSELILHADNVEKEMQSLKENIKTMEMEIKQFQDNQENQDYQPSPPSNEVIPITRFHRFASTYQQILMHAIDIPDEKWSSVIKKDAKVALYGQGMEVIDYDSDKELFFDIQEDAECEKTTMVYPAIIRRKDKMIIAKGMVFKPY